MSSPYPPCLPDNPVAPSTAVRALGHVRWESQLPNGNERRRRFRYEARYWRRCFPRCLYGKSVSWIRGLNECIRMISHVDIFRTMTRSELPPPKYHFGICRDGNLTVYNRIYFHPFFSSLRFFFTALLVACLLFAVYRLLFTICCLEHFLTPRTTSPINKQIGS